MNPLRPLFAILVLPGTVLGLVPYWLLRSFGSQSTAWDGALQLAGALLLIAGLSLLGWCIYLFARVGRGTLAPWDPTQALVAAGPYGYTRNPMITGVLLTLCGEALFFRSAAIGVFAVAFFVVNHLFFIYVEEPGLEKRFGQSYRDYKARVPRWLPKLQR
ncbi:MAG: isoprenylcysteine carboxylmethyltransferase family protein [Anaerolineales bacterium]|nr:isoprenylcysteine carboxylmethyltransferase family protein [Anaerolineales bacterium]